AAGRKAPPPNPAGAPSSAALPPAAERANGNAAALAESDDDLEPHRRGFVARFLKTVVLVVLLLAAVWFAWTWRTELSKLIGAIGVGSTTSGLAATDRVGIEVPPLRGFGPDTAQMDANLQATPLWRILKREFPDWYADRLKEVVGLTQQNKDDANIAQQMGRALVSL